MIKKRDKTIVLFEKNGSNMALLVKKNDIEAVENTDLPTPIHHLGPEL